MKATFVYAPEEKKITVRIEPESDAEDVLVRVMEYNAPTFTMDNEGGYLEGTFTL